MAKLKLVASPTFKAKVPVPLAGGDPVDVEMTFKHRKKSELDDWVKSRAEKEDWVSFMEMVEGWELEDSFNEENVRALLENYIGAAFATFQTYIDQLVQGRAKNSRLPL